MTPQAWEGLICLEKIVELLNFNGMELYCPTCSAVLDPAEVNIAADLAKCTQCNSLHKVSELTQERRSVVPHESQEVSVVPPRHSKIAVSTEDQSAIEFSTPRAGLWGPHLFIGGFSTFWLAFISVWTWGASLGSIFFALFSIPFWLVGIGLMSSFINSVFGQEILRLEDDHLVLIKKRPIAPKTIRVRYEEIDSVSKGKVNVNTIFPVNMNANATTTTGGKRGQLIGPRIRMGVKEESFFADVSDAEMDWIIKVIDTAVRKKKEERQYFG